MQSRSSLVILLIVIAVNVVIINISAAREKYAEMVYIPPGEFTMGASKVDGRIGLEVGVDSLPRHIVYVEGFYIDKYEVSNKKYMEFIMNTGNRPPSMWTTPFYFAGGDNYPVVDLSWEDADNYCNWAGKELPSEVQWEKAARGIDGRKYPWGGEFDKKKCNIRSSGYGFVRPVESFPLGASPYGVFNMCGNVMEWTSSWYLPYPDSRLKRRSFGKKYRVLRGGAWNSPHPLGRVTDRQSVAPKWDHPAHGVRCVKIN